MTSGDSSRMKVLLVGRRGQLGWELQRTLAPLGELHCVGRPELDLTSTEAIRNVVRSARPHIIVNAAAFTDVNGAESNVETAHAINGVAPGVLATELRQVGGRLLVHYSTDYVFDGSSRRPYKEDDVVSPLNTYGRTKLEGERAIAQAGTPHLIFRTEWVYAGRGKNFLLTILRLAREGKPLRIIGDQVGSPTWARMLAEATALALMRVDAIGIEEASGIYHMTASGETNWCEFARHILTEVSRVNEAARDWCRKGLDKLQRISTAEYPTPAERPAYSVLSTDKLAKTFNIHMPHWEGQLRQCVQELCASECVQSR